MKIKNLSTNKIFSLIIIGYILYMVTLSLLGIPNGVWMPLAAPVFYSDNLKPIDANIPSTLSFKEYNKLKDSIITIRNLKNGDGFLHGSAIEAQNVLGTWSSLSCDTCSLKMYNDALFNNTNTIHIQYYIELPAWTLKLKNTTYTNEDPEILAGTAKTTFHSDSVQFYVSHNQAYVRKIVGKHLMVKGKDEIKYDATDVPVKFRYNQSAKCLMIPVNKSTKETLDIVIMVLGIVLAVYFLALIFLFIKFVIDLSKGLAFTDINLGRLKLIAFTLLACPILTLLFNILMRLIFYSYFTSDVVLSSAVWDNAWKMIVAGFVFYVLFRAFRQGKILKEEQELTV